MMEPIEGFCILSFNTGTIDTNMRLFIIRLLRRLLLWLEGVPSESGVSDKILLMNARMHVTKMDKTKHTGSYKRAKVIADLKRKFPGRRNRDLSRAVEEAVQLDIP